MGVTCDTHGWKEKYIQDYVGNPEENGALGRPRRRWKNNIKMVHIETRWALTRFILLRKIDGFLLNRVTNHWFQ